MLNWRIKTICLFLQRGQGPPFGIWYKNTSHKGGFNSGEARKAKIQKMGRNYICFRRFPCGHVLAIRLRLSWSLLKPLEEEFPQIFWNFAATIWHLILFGAPLPVSQLALSKMLPTDLRLCRANPPVKELTRKTKQRSPRKCHKKRVTRGRSRKRSSVRGGLTRELLDYFSQKLCNAWHFVAEFPPQRQFATCGISWVLWIGMLSPWDSEWQLEPL